MRRERKGDLLLLTVALIWAGTYTVDGAMVQRASPLIYLSARFLVAAVLFALLFGRSLLGLTRQVVWHGALIGFFLYLEFFLQLQGLVYTSPAKMGFITGLFIVITPLLSVWLTQAQLTRENILGVVLAMTGFALLVYPGRSGQINIGDLLGLGAAVSSSLHILYMGVYVRRHDVNQINTIQILATALFFIITASVTQGILAFTKAVPAVLVPETRGVPLTLQFLLSVLYTAVLATVVLFSLQARGQRYVSATRTVIIFSLSPVFAAIISYFTLGDWIGWRGYVGGLLTVIGVIVSESKLLTPVKPTVERLASVPPPD
jgi:drug/metabolite transporter (DMT)-like permease